MRSTVTVSVDVVRNDVIDNLDHPVAEKLRLVDVESITDEDKAVASENLDSTLYIRWVKNLNTPKSIVCLEILALLHDLGCVAFVTVPPELGVAFG
jgi:hypothetical protein